MERALAEHRTAIERFASRLEHVSDEAWRAAPAEGRWSPAEVAEHLVLYYRMLLEVLAGDRDVRLRVRPMVARLLRWFLLSHMLFHRSWPVRARSPREIRPTTAPADRGAALRELRELAARFEAAIPEAQSRRGLTLVHPVFGPLRPLRFLRFSTVHVDHHREQVERMLPTERADA